MDVKSDRLKALPPYLFIEIDRKKREKMAAGVDVINLGVGDPDRPTPDFIQNAMVDAIRDPANHRYPFDEGVPAFREEAAKYITKRFGVQLDWQSQIITTIGSKDGIAHLPLAVVNPDDVVLVPSPGYPVYRSGAIFAGARPWEMKLESEAGWMPDLDAIPNDVLEQAKLIWVNYPNNPTAAMASRQFYEKLVLLAKQWDLIVASDLAYAETYYDDRPLSILEVEGAMDCCVEFHSLSKTFNMTGWRIGFAAGNADILSALASVKGNCDSGQFNAIQVAGAEALRNVDHPDVRHMVDVYRKRRDTLCDGLNALGWQVDKPGASFFVWGRVPTEETSMQFAGRVLEESGVVLIPGGGFAEHCDQWFRAALTVEEPRLQEALARLT